MVQILQAKGIGDIMLRMQVGNSIKRVVLNDVYYVPEVRKNLMSVSQIEKKGHEIMIKNGKITIRNIYTKKILCVALRNNDLYIVKR